VPVDDYTPTPEDVGAVTLVRTVDRVGVQTGTFTADTRPTDSQLQVLIEKAVGDVSDRIGSDIPESLWQTATNIASIRTAMLIELSLFAHEIRSGISPYEEYKKLYEEELDKLTLAINAYEAGQDPTNAPGNLARFGFPQPTGILGRKL